MTNFTNEQLEAWAGLGPWEWATNSDGEFECPRRVSDGQWIVTSRLNHSLSALSEIHRDALTAAPDIAAALLAERKAREVEVGELKFEAGEKLALWAYEEVGVDPELTPGLHDMLNLTGHTEEPCPLTPRKDQPYD